MNEYYLVYSHQEKDGAFDLIYSLGDSHHKQNSYRSIKDV